MKKTQTENIDLSFRFKEVTVLFEELVPDKKLVTMGEYVDKMSKLPAEEFKQKIIHYNLFLKSKPKRTDFINFDDDGFWLSDNEPLFKDFVTADDVSSDDNKVAYKDRTYIMFLKDEKKDVVIQNDQFITDECTYNEVAIAFNKKNGLDALEFA